MNETINSRIRSVREEFCGGSNVEFARILKREPNTTSNWMRDGYNVGKGIAEEIATEFSVSKGWLLTGEGNMLKKSPPIGEPAADVVTMPREIWAVIENQAASLRIKEESMLLRDKSLATKDEQVSKLIALLTLQLNKKGDSVDEK